MLEMESLTTNAISDLFQLEHSNENKKFINISKKFQILKKQKETNIIKITLSDGDSFYNNFIFSFSDSQNIFIYDLIEIKKMLISLIKEEKHFYIFKFSLLFQAIDLIGNPIEYKLIKSSSNQNQAIETKKRVLTIKSVTIIGLNSKREVSFTTSKLNNEKDNVTTPTKENKNINRTSLTTPKTSSNLKISYDYLRVNIKEIKSLKNSKIKNNQKYEFKGTIKSLINKISNTYEGCPKCFSMLKINLINFTCRKCNENVNTPKVYFNLNLLFQDCTGDIVLYIPHSVSENLIKKINKENKITPEDFRTACERDDDTLINKFKNIFVCREIMFKFRLTSSKNSSINRVSILWFENYNKNKEFRFVMNKLKGDLNL